MGLRAHIVSQFRWPRGLPGWLAGQIMARRASNQARNAWTVELLEIGPDDRVLELGCGPGLALSHVAGRLEAGQTTGLDHSATILRQAEKRLNTHIAAGRVKLAQGGLDHLPALPGPFDKIFCVNVVQFFPARARALRALTAIAAPGGLVACTYQPRHARPTRGDALGMADDVAAAMRDAGLEQIRVEELDLRPVPAVCVLGRKAAA